jgi:metallo-beta-lactamase family protein
MALAALDVYRKAIAERSAEIAPSLLAQGAHALRPPQLFELHTAAESAAINEPAVPSVIISAAGMATGGRVLHHLQHLLPDPRNTVIIAGFAAAGTRARDLIDGARVLKIFGKYVPVRAEIVNLPVFSAHADADELISWMAAAPSVGITYVVHGEPEASAVLRDAVENELDRLAVVPQW